MNNALGEYLCPLQYKCDTDKTSETCRYASQYGGVTSITAKRCPSGKRCTGSQTSAKCVTKELSVPGDECEVDKQCRSGKCEGLRCTGKSAGESCIAHEDCGVGLYCYAIKLKNVNSNCESDIECETSSGCWNGICTKYLSLTLGTSIGNMGWDINITAQATLPLLKEVKFFAQNRKRQVTSSNVKIT